MLEQNDLARSTALTAPSLADAVTKLARAFAGAGMETPALDARLLVLHACGLRHEDMILNPDRELAPDEWAEIEALVARRLAHEPVSRIIGEREFWGRTFSITPQTLDPRPDTETLIEAALEIVQQERRKDEPLRILDLGTGSGCILISLLGELPGAHGTGTDKSARALAVARENAERHGVSARADFVQTDWLEGVEGLFHLIVSNPPYIPCNEIGELSAEVRCHDPQMALDGGEDGYAAYRAIIPGLDRALAPGGWVLLEVGCGQAEAVAAMLDDAGFSANGVGEGFARDLAGIRRVVARRKHVTQKPIRGKKTFGNIG